MGRGRAKAKQTKVARELKYNAPQTDFDALRAELDRFALPRRFAYVPALPMTPTGKIDRKALNAMLA